MLTRIVFAVATLWAASTDVVAQQPASAPVERTILDTSDLWRMRVVWETDEVQLKDGSVDYVKLAFDRKGVNVLAVGIHRAPAD